MDDRHEFRSIAACGVEARAEPNRPQQIIGYAAVFDSLSEDLGGFREKIAPGAFSNSIASDNVYALWQHRSEFPIGSTDTQTLALNEDTRGLAVEIKLPATTWGQDAYEGVRSRLVKHFSFGFVVLRDAWDYSDPSMPIRTLEEVQLVEVSPVTFPAYPQTTAGVRAIVAEMEMRRNGAGVDANLRAKTDAQVREILMARVRIAEIEF